MEVPEHRRGRGKGELYLAGEQIGQIRRAIRHVNDVHAGHHPEQFEGEMRRRPGTLRSIVELARISLSVGNELRDRLHRDRWMDHDDEGRIAKKRNRRDVADEIEIEIWVERSAGRIP